MNDQYCHIIYTFDEYFQNDDYEMFFNDDPVDAIFNKTELDNSEEKGVFISIEGMTGKLTVTKCSLDKYNDLVDAGEIEEDQWPDFGFNFHYPGEPDSDE